MCSLYNIDSEKFDVISKIMLNNLKQYIILEYIIIIYSQK